MSAKDKGLCSNCNDRPAAVKGRCMPCYNYWYVRGQKTERPLDMLYVRRRRQNPVRECCNCGEIKILKAHDLCNACYSYTLQNGTPRPQSVIDKARARQEDTRIHPCQCGEGPGIHRYILRTNMGSTHGRTVPHVTDVYMLCDACLELAHELENEDTFALPPRPGPQAYVRAGRYTNRVR